MRGSYGIVFVLVLLSFLVQASAPDGDFTRLVIIWLQGATLVFAVRIQRPFPFGPSTPGTFSGYERRHFTIVPSATAYSLVPKTRTASACDYADSV